MSDIMERPRYESALISPEEAAVVRAIQRPSYTLTNEACHPHLFAHIEAALAEWGWLVPAWVEFIRATFDPDESGTIVMKNAEEYRTVYLRLGNGWTRVPDDQREKWVMHELLHISTNHIFDVFHDLLEATTNEGEPLNKWADEQARKAIERTTNDLERVLWERHSSNKAIG